ncbi:uncharacterized protein LOC117958235, partial [Tachysurus ichikawai]
MAVFLGLKHFLPDLRDCHVLVRMDNTAEVSYINHQGGLRSRPLYKLARAALLWSRDRLLSLRAIYIPGRLNVRADALSRQGPRPGEWRLHPVVVEFIWRRFYRAQVDLFATQETSHRPLWFSLSHPAPLGLDAMVQSWPRLRLYAFPPIALLPGVLERVRRDGVRLLLEGSPLTGGRNPGSPPPRAVEAVAVAPEGAQFIAADLSTEVVETLLHSKASSTRRSYAPRWQLFTSWCEHHGLEPVNCPIGSVLEFLQEQFAAGLTPSTLKVYVSAVVAYSTLPAGQSLGRHPVVTRFLHGARRLRPGTRPRVPVWDLAVVLAALSEPPFEPLTEVALRFLSIKTTFLLAISSLKRIGDLQALSMAPSCLELPLAWPECFSIQNLAPEQERQNRLCPVRALVTYLRRTSPWRKSEQLLVCYGPNRKGFPATKQTLSRWVVDAIVSAHESSGLPAPLGVRAHSTRGVAASTAWSSGVALQDICDAAPLTFIRFHDLDLRATPGSSVLRAGQALTL